MNYYKARQRKGDGRWDWTRMNDGRIWASAPCSGHADGHATREEAERHYYDHRLETAREYEYPDVQRRCQLCEAWTQKSLGWPDGPTYDLCDDHRNREGLARVYEFAPGLQIASSW